MKASLDGIDRIKTDYLEILFILSIPSKLALLPPSKLYATLPRLGQTAPRAGLFRRAF
ncbi:hypothetical protein GobsT_24370 [Gemmata obscuriglobus]|nr:hypothetical protein GobsT_24370 [Gemmata obscuriglobus]VTS04879.1 unnamed protein product [Gemmata obscuriglobus UQM 2246]